MCIFKIMIFEVDVFEFVLLKAQKFDTDIFG